MRLPFLPFLLLWFVSGSAQLYASYRKFAVAQLCVSSREFAVDNCTAFCPTFDRNRDDIPMAVCEERATVTGNGTAYACVCLDYPVKAAPLVYYPHMEGNETRCASSLATARSQLDMTLLDLLCVCSQLYAATHLMYIAVLSGMCSCTQHKCTTISASALLLCISCMFGTLIYLWSVAAQGKGVFRNAWLVYDFVLLTASISLAAGLVLLYTSVCDMVFGGDDEAGWRHWINITFWTLISGSVLLAAFAVIGSRTGADPSWINAAKDIGGVLATLTFLYSSVFMVVAHCKIHAVVRKHSEEKTKPALVIKMEDLCVAIWRYYYPLLVIVVVCNMAWYARAACPAHSAVSPTTYWLIEFLYALFNNGVAMELMACLLEGKRVPTFPGCLCRRRVQSQSPSPKPFSPRKITGLQFTPALGKALALLTKHGLETKRRKEFPVEVAIESLLSTSPLMVAAAPDMDLMSSVEHFLQYCGDGEGKIAPEFADMPVGSLLRGGWKQHVLTTADIPRLRGKAKKCLQWAQDPARAAIGRTAVDEAAAIMLYTQHSCLYPMLNAALRDHAHPENLNSFLPYLKLLLKGLNKLPLLRKKVYRGVNMDLHEEYNQLQGQVFRWWAFSSTTQCESVTRDFLGDTGKSTLFKIDGIGVDIAAFSAFPNESEVLLLPGTCLVVEPGVMVGNNRWEFQASVWNAAQQQRQQHQQHQQHQQQQQQQHQHHHQQHHQHQQQQHHQHRGEVKNEGRLEGMSPSTLPGHYDRGASIPQFQNTDLPHPGWEQLDHFTGGVYK